MDEEPRPQCLLCLWQHLGKEPDALLPRGRLVSVRLRTRHVPGAAVTALTLPSFLAAGRSV